MREYRSFVLVFNVDLQGPRLVRILGIVFLFLTGRCDSPYDILRGHGLGFMRYPCHPGQHKNPVFVWPDREKSTVDSLGICTSSDSISCLSHMRNGDNHRMPSAGNLGWKVVGDPDFRGDCSQELTSPSFSYRVLGLHFSKPKMEGNPPPNRRLPML